MSQSVKSSRHPRIIGDFGENLIRNWLSRSGFEVTIVDHTGIDIVAYNPVTGQRIGITVKSRTKSAGKESESVNLFSYQKGKDDRRKALDACKAFACEPWIAVYVETSDGADAYVTSLSNYDSKYRGSEGKAIDDWKEGRGSIQERSCRETRPNQLSHTQLDLVEANGTSIGNTADFGTCSAVSHLTCQLFPSPFGRDQSLKCAPEIQVRQRWFPSAK